MAAITSTANNVVPSADAEYYTNEDKTETIAHEAFTAGASAYKYSDGTFGLTDANGTAVTNTGVGLFANSGGAGQPCKIVKYDPNLAIGATVILGMVYINSGTPGVLTEYPDKATGWHVQPMCMAVDATHVCVSVFPVCSSAIA